MIYTEVCKLLGIKYPIIQGGMAWVSDASLASAVSNGGGLGLISAMSGDSEWLRNEIIKTRAMTDKPFGVNIMLMSPFVEQIAEIVTELQVPVVTTGAGNPTKYMERWLAAGIKVIPVIPSTALAKKMERSGASAVIAEGMEAGGHVGELTTMSLLPQVRDAVNIPLIAAGGIGDGRGIAASFMLGATGVQVGTRFLVAKEADIHQTYKDMVIRAKDIDTIVTGKRLGHPVRSLKSTFSREFARKEYDSSVTNQELEDYGSGALRVAVQKGDANEGCFMAGQVAGIIKKEQTAAEIIDEMFEQAEVVLKGAVEWTR